MNPTSKESRIGTRYGNLVVIGLAETYVSPQGHRQSRFLCRCDCGGTVVKDRSAFKPSKLKLNGCNECFSKRMSDLNTVHAGSKGGKTRLFNIWKDMRRRCRDVTRDVTYAVRGISVCQEWDDFAVFRDWAQSHGYEDNLTIERDDVNGNYEPSNCRWIPRAEQARNKMTTRHIKFMGMQMIASEAERAIGLTNGTINNRRKKDKTTHQEAFDKILVEYIVGNLSDERMAA